MAYEHLLSIPPLISPPWGFVNLLPRVILSCAVHRDNFLILPVPRQSSDSFVSIVREIVYRTLKQTGSGRVSKLDSVWMSEVRPRVRVVLFRVASEYERRLKQKETAYWIDVLPRVEKKKNWKEWYEKEILWENCINIIIVSRNFFPQREGEILWLNCLRSIWISILIKANYWHWSVFEMEVSSVQSITIMRIFFRGIGYLSKFIIHKLGGCRNLGVKVETVSSLEGWAVRGVFQVSSWPWKKIHGQQVPCSLL